MTDGDLTDADREGELGWLLPRLIAGAFLLLTVGLVLDAIDVRPGRLRR